MSVIKIHRPSEEERKRLDIPETPKAVGPWAVWEGQPSSFEWSYADWEIAYVYEGRVLVTTDSGEVEITAGDMVTFPKGLTCTWKIIEKIRKVYKFESD